MQSTSTYIQYEKRVSRPRYFVKQEGFSKFVRVSFCVERCSCRCGRYCTSTPPYYYWQWRMECGLSPDSQRQSQNELMRGCAVRTRRVGYHVSQSVTMPDDPSRYGGRVIIQSYFGGSNTCMWDSFDWTVSKYSAETHSSKTSSLFFLLYSIVYTLCILLVCVLMQKQS